MKNEQANEMVHIACMEINHCLVVSLSYDLYDEVIIALRKTVFEKLMAPELLGVIIDISGITIMDHADVNVLLQLSEQIRLLGKKSVFIGIQAGVAMAISDLSHEKINKLVTAVSLQTAQTLLHQ